MAVAVTAVKARWERSCWLAKRKFSSVNEVRARTNNLVQHHEEIVVSKAGLEKRNTRKGSLGKTPPLSGKHAGWLALQLELALTSCWVFRLFSSW